MIQIREITFKEGVPILEQAEREKIFVKMRAEENLTLLKLVDKYWGHKYCELFAIHKKSKCIGLIASFPHERAKVISLGIVYLVPLERNKGYGQEAISLFLQHVKNAGFKSICVTTWGANNLSNKVFYNLKFIEIKRVKNDRVDGDCTVVYMKEL